jgi:hypothetical protein
MEFSQHPFSQPDESTGLLTPTPIYILAALVFSATLAYAATTWDGNIATPVALDPVSSNAPGIAIDLLMARVALPLASDSDVGSGYVEFEPPPSEPRGIPGPLQTSTTEQVHESTKQSSQTAKLVGD